MTNHEEPDWDNQWGRAQNTAAWVMGVGLSIFLGLGLGIAACFVFNDNAIGTIIGIGVFGLSLDICFRGRN